MKVEIQRFNEILVKVFHKICEVVRIILVVSIGKKSKKHFKINKYAFGLLKYLSVVEYAKRKYERGILGLRILGGSVFSVYTGFHEIKKKLRHLVIVYVCKSVREDPRQFPWSGFPRYFDYR